MLKMSEDDLLASTFLLLLRLKSKDYFYDGKEKLIGSLLIMDCGAGRSIIEIAMFTWLLDFFYAKLSSETVTLTRRMVELSS